MKIGSFKANQTYAFNRGLLPDISRTIDTQGANGVFLSCGGGQMSESDDIYRLYTPLECWRLMGFSDADFTRAKKSGVSDRQLYKQSGNSIVVNVLEAIFGQILTVKSGEEEFFNE